MTRGKRPSATNRFTQQVAVRAPGSSQDRLNIGEIRNLQRAEVSQFNDNGIYLPNPSTDAPFDRHAPQTYEQKVYGLGLAPNIPQHFWQLRNGDAGPGSSIFRVTELFQRLAPQGIRTAATPYSKAIQIATMRSTDLRPRYFHANLFSIGRVTNDDTPGGAPPLSTAEISRFAAGIPAGTPSITGNTQFNIPQFSTTKFRIMVFDESGQRFVDVDVLGTRSMNVYGFGVTVFALIKEDGYEINRQVDNPSLGPGVIDQGVVGARIVPIRSNDQKNVSNRTVTIISPGFGASPTVLPIPPGAKRVQCYTNAVGAAAIPVFFATEDPLNPLGTLTGSQGVIDLSPTVSVFSVSSIYEIPNSNSIVIFNPPGTLGGFWSFVFEVTS